MEERTRTGPDGALTTKVVANRVYRDTAGRTRIEWRISDTRSGALEVIYLIDPVSSSATTLFLGVRVAYRTAVPRSRSGGFQVGFPAGEPLPAGDWQTKTEPLGTRTMEGIEVQGTRSTQTLKSEPSLTAVWETWSSPALGIQMLVEASGPNWKQTAKLQNLERGEPDPSLFVIPSDYTIQD